MSANHPTPWEARKHGNILLIYDAKGQTIVPTDPETAKEIVAATNSHEALLEAAKVSGASERLWLVSELREGNTPFDDALVNHQSVIHLTERES